MLFTCLFPDPEEIDYDVNVISEARGRRLHGKSAPIQIK